MSRKNEYKEFNDYWNKTIKGDSWTILEREACFMGWLEAKKRALNLYNVSNRIEDTCAKEEPLIIEIDKDHLVELYNFAYEQAVKTGKVEELKEIDSKLSS